MPSIIGFNSGPILLENSVIIGTTLSVKNVTIGVMPSSTKEPTVSLPSSNAILSRSILPANVSAFSVACPAKVSLNANVISSKLIVLSSAADKPTPNLPNAASLPS